MNKEEVDHKSCWIEKCSCKSKGYTNMYRFYGVFGYGKILQNFCNTECFEGECKHHAWRSLLLLSCQEDIHHLFSHFFPHRILFLHYLFTTLMVETMRERILV